MESSIRRLIATTLAVVGTAGGASAGALNHFQCYDVHNTSTTPVGLVQVADQFGSASVQVDLPKRLCNPADKNGEDPTAPLDPDHLVGYRLRQWTPPFRPLASQTIADQFGTLVLDVLRPDYLLVPSAKSLTAAVPPGSFTPAIDHFTCYRVAQARRRVPTVSVTDQFGTLALAVKRPMHLCVPTAKNGGAILDPVSHLMCYQVRARSRPPSQRGLFVFIDNQFGPDRLTSFRATELCVPALKEPDGPAPTPTPTPPGGGTATPTPTASRTPPPPGSTCVTDEDCRRDLCVVEACGPDTLTCQVTAAKDCPATAGPCTTNGRCNPATGECVVDPLGDCCTTAAECDDANVCTDDSCCLETDGCVFYAGETPIPPGACRHRTGIVCLGQLCDPIEGCRALDCDDNDACTTDIVAGGCIHIRKDCDDQNACTLDDCDPVTGECRHTHPPFICIYGLCDPLTGRCPGPPNCDDGNPCTTDVLSGGFCFSNPKNCDDQNACTSDYCDPQTGACRNFSTIICLAPSTCDPSTGQCVTTPCEDRCNDGNPCTIDTCHHLTAACVNTPISCADNDACTVDSCVTNALGGADCRHERKPDCCDARIPGHCDDKNPCTRDTCTGTGESPGICRHEPVCCQQHIECNDKNPCTEDTCDPRIGCKYDDPIPSGCLLPAPCCTATDEHGFCIADNCPSGWTCCRPGTGPTTGYQGGCQLRNYFTVYSCNSVYESCKKLPVYPEYPGDYSCPYTDVNPYFRAYERCQVVPGVSHCLNDPNGDGTRRLCTRDEDCCYLVGICSNDPFYRPCRKDADCPTNAFGPGTCRGNIQCPDSERACRRECL